MPFSAHRRRLSALLAAAGLAAAAAAVAAAAEETIVLRIDGRAGTPFAATCELRTASGKQTIMIDRKEQASWYGYSELLKRALGSAGALQRAGIEAGDMVAIILPTCPEFCDVFWGALFAGAIPVPLYPPVRLGRMDEYQHNTARMLRHISA